MIDTNYWRLSIALEGGFRPLHYEACSRGLGVLPGWVWDRVRQLHVKAMHNFE